MKDGTLKSNKDRRIKERHAAPCLQVTVRPSGLRRWLKRPTIVQCVDINRYGMAVISPISYKAKDRITIDFKGKYISQSNVSAVITSNESLPGQYRLGITFSYSTCNKQYSRNVDNALSRIERLYNERYSLSKKAS